MKKILYGFLIAIGVMVGAYLIYKVTTYDYCPLYYGVVCIPKN
jgi:hypothetical protein